MKLIKLTINGPSAVRFTIEAVEDKIGNRVCRICNMTISEFNIGSISKKGFVCSRLTCLVKSQERKIYE